MAWTTGVLAGDVEEDQHREFVEARDMLVDASGAAVTEAACPWDNTTGTSCTSCGATATRPSTPATGARPVWVLAPA